MVVIGISWILYWALIDVLAVAPLKSAIITGVVFVLLGLVLGERPWVRK